MLSFEHKKSIFNSYPELSEKPIRNERFNYIFPGSLQSGKVLARELNQSGNGYVNGKYLSYEMINGKAHIVDSRGWILIKNFSEEQLHEIIKDVMFSMKQVKKK